MSINDNPESAAIVNAIARLGDSLNLPITAEGIEDAAIEERLRALGCAKGQGYLYGRPLGAAQRPARCSRRSACWHSAPDRQRASAARHCASGCAREAPNADHC